MFMSLMEQIRPMGNTVTLEVVDQQQKNTFLQLPVSRETKSIIARVIKTGAKCSEVKPGDKVLVDAYCESIPLGSVFFVKETQIAAVLNV
jgi:co-chaperonin GroES (HSP10)